MSKRQRNDSSGGLASKSKKKAKHRPDVPNETFLEVLRSVSRQDLESAQLGGRFLRDFIRQNEEKELPLRRIDVVEIGKVARHQVPTRRGTRDGAEYWTPSCEVRIEKRRRGWCEGIERQLRFEDVRQMLSCLRLATVCGVQINLDVEDKALRAQLGDFCNTVFGELSLPEVAVGGLEIVMPNCGADVVLRAVNAFRSIRSITLDTRYLRPYAMRTFDATFFGGIAERGATHFEFGIECPMETRSSALLPFLLAEPLVERGFSGGLVRLEKDFVAQVHNRISELEDLPEPVQIIFGCCDQDLDASGFEKYEIKDWQQMGNQWNQLIRFTDLPNGLTLEIGKNSEQEHDVVIEVFRDD